MESVKDVWQGGILGKLPVVVGALPLFACLIGPISVLIGDVEEPLPPAAMGRPVTSDLDSPAGTPSEPAPSSGPRPNKPRPPFVTRGLGLTREGWEKRHGKGSPESDDYVQYGDGTFENAPEQVVTLYLSQSLVARFPAGERVPPAAGGWEVDRHFTVVYPVDEDRVNRMVIGLGRALEPVDAPIR